MLILKVTIACSSGSDLIYILVRSKLFSSWLSFLPYFAFCLWIFPDKLFQVYIRTMYCYHIQAYLQRLEISFNAP